MTMAGQPPADGKMSGYNDFWVPQSRPALEEGEEQLNESGVVAFNTSVIEGMPRFTRPARRRYSKYFKRRELDDGTVLFRFPPMLQWLSLAQHKMARARRDIPLERFPHRVDYRPLTPLDMQAVAEDLYANPLQHTPAVLAAKHGTSPEFISMVKNILPRPRIKQAAQLLTSTLAAEGERRRLQRVRAGLAGEDGTPIAPDVTWRDRIDPAAGPLQAPLKYMTPTAPIYHQDPRMRPELTVAWNHAYVGPGYGLAHLKKLYLTKQAEKQEADPSYTPPDPDSASPAARAAVRAERARLGLPQHMSSWYNGTFRDVRRRRRWDAAAGRYVVANEFAEAQRRAAPQTPTHRQSLAGPAPPVVEYSRYAQHGEW